MDLKAFYQKVRQVAEKIAEAYVVVISLDTPGCWKYSLDFVPRKPVAYGEANAVLFDAIAFLRNNPQDAGQAAEVPLSIIRILESLRRKRALTNEEALEIYKKMGLAKFLAAAPTPLE